MARGKHTKDGYPWGITSKEQTQVNVPKVIAPEVKQLAQELWEKRKEESTQLSSSESTGETEDN